MIAILIVGLFFTGTARIGSAAETDDLPDTVTGVVEDIVDGSKEFWESEETQSRWEQEKSRMLEALDTMKEMGFSTTGILETVRHSYEHHAQEKVEEKTQELQEQVKEQAQELGQQAAEQVEKKAEEITDNAIDTFFRKIKEAVADLFE